MPHSAPVPSRRLHLTAAPPEGTDRRSPEAIESPPATVEQRSGGSAPVGTVIGVCVGVIRPRQAALWRGRSGSAKPELDGSAEDEVDALSLTNPLVSLEDTASEISSNGESPPAFVGPTRSIGQCSNGNANIPGNGATCVDGPMLFELRKGRVGLWKGQSEQSTVWTQFGLGFQRPLAHRKFANPFRKRRSRIATALGR
jgi:hypothetical protein